MDGRDERVVALVVGHWTERRSILRHHGVDELGRLRRRVEALAVHLVVSRRGEVVGRVPIHGLDASEFGLEVGWCLASVVLLKKPHLFFSCLLLCLVLILEILHLFLKLFQKLLNCWLIFSS